MKHVCGVCGYVYDEGLEGVKFADLPEGWTCPWCGGAKSAFKPKAGEAEAGPEYEPKRIATQEFDDEMHQVSFGQLAAICSNLARGCEKQYKAEAQARFLELARYFDSMAAEAGESEVADLLALVKNDLGEGYPALSAAGESEGDRGALRVKVWGEKVTTIQKSLLERYEREGEKFLDNTQVWICTVCGFIYVGDKAPALCPVCKVPDWKFETVKGR